MMMLLQVIGSLGLFLFGMKAMGDALQKLSGDRLRAALGSMTGNRVKGILSGFGITCAVQSSSATTVMVVSFVDAGLLTLKQAVGVIMGANLGTTTTGWIIALLGFKLSLSSLALPVIGVGVMMLLFLKKGQWQNLGMFLVGFGILFMGLDMLKNSVPQLDADSPVLKWIAHYSDMGFWSVLIFLLFGTVLTMVVQASSVTMAITITMAAKGWINIDLACAMVLGENIGTTLTANLAALATGINAKRAAFAHFIFNVLGVIWVLCVYALFMKMICFMVPVSMSPSHETLKAMDLENFASLQGAEKLAAAERIAIPARLAMFHTMFNLTNIFVLVWFVGTIEKITRFVIRGTHKPDAAARVENLSGKIVGMGELAILEGQKELMAFAKMAGEMFAGFVHVIRNPDTDLSKEVDHLRSIEDESDRMSMALTNFFVQCAHLDLSASAMKIVTRNMMIVPELEEMCDACFRLIKIARKRYRRQYTESILKSQGFGDFCDEMANFVTYAQRSLGQGEIPPSVLAEAQVVRKNLDKVRKQLRREAIENMRTDGVSKGSILFIELLSACERVSSHALNILEAMGAKESV